LSARHTKLAALLAAAWEAEVGSARRLSELAERASDRRIRARLLVLAAFCRAHASRNLSRLVALGQGPLPVPDYRSDMETVVEGLHHEEGLARILAERYRVMATLARQQGDLSTSWVCELNRSEEEDRADELAGILRDGVDTVIPFGDPTMNAGA
jgi:hypothetical protein